MTATKQQPGTARPPHLAALDRMSALVGVGRTSIKTLRLTRALGDLRTALKEEIRFAGQQGDGALGERQLLAALDRYQNGELS